MNHLATCKKLSLAIAIQLALLSQVSAADKVSTANSPAGKDGSVQANDAYIEKMQIIGQSQGLSKQTGSATLIDELALEQFKFDDINRVLYSVPGVNIREEDGYGLRPNIGFRGTTPERSKKINIMEDGVLIGPAPYSAASAYYFPVTSKMTAIEVFKGPSGIKYGPNTVAGSLNMVTRAVPQSSEGLVDISGGSHGFAKAHAHYGDTIGDVGFLLEGVHMRADGFKVLDGGGDTGFEKNDIMAKLRYDLAGKSFNQTFELKLAYADENSNETYLGLSDADFAANPNRRYAASQLDHMQWSHSQVQFNHFISGDNIDVITRVYRNDFDRAWNKINGFTPFDDTYESLQQILANPDESDNTRTFYSILTGAQDSITEAQQIILGNNDRTYYSQGIQSDIDLQLELFGLKHQLATGVRFHQDQIERNHTLNTYLMRQGNLVSDGKGTKVSTTDREKTDALSVYLQDTISINALDLTLGVRGEFIDAHYQNRAAGQALDYLNKSTRIWLPSFSAFYTLSDNAGLLFGVHEGFLPTSPKQDPSIDVESSINYELGGRYNDGDFNLEVIGFFNDISNLKEGCQFSSCGSDDDTEFNGGEVDVFGVELTSGYSITLTDDLSLPLSLSYTYTHSEFKTSFDSEFDMWGNVTAGDELPYLAKDQLAINIGLVSNQWDVNMIVRYIGEMKEASGEGVALSGSSTDALTVVDMSASYNFDQYGLIYLKADNLLDSQKIVSRRPYGARPSKAQQFQIGYQYRF